jgi:hypothetical protein
MRYRVLKVALVASLLTWVGCGGSGGTSILNRLGTGTGTVVLLASDQPVCDVTSFQVTVTGITLVPQNGSTPVSVLSSSQPVTIDLASLMDVSALLNVADVPAATYSQITFTLSNPQLTSVDFTQDPPVPATIAPTMPSLTVTYDISPALTVSTNGTAGLQVDFDLLNSVSVDTENNITGEVNLLAQAAPVAAASDTGFGELQDLHGLVQSVSTTGSGSFTGSVTIQTADGNNLVVNLTSTTVLNGLTSGLSAMVPQMFVEMAAYVDSSGNVVAHRLTAEDVDQASLQHAGLIGEVTSVTRLGTGFVSQFTLVVREEFPNVSPDIPLQSTVDVNVEPSTTFNLSAPEDNAEQMSFDGTNLGLGQVVTAHGNYVPGQRGVPAVLNATSLYLHTQSVPGNFASVLAVGQDGKTGGFAFTPCSGVFQGQTISALTSSGTTFEGVTDLNGLTTTPTLLVRGQVFFEPTLTSAGTVTLTPPATVLVAGKVHQLP